MTDLIVPPSLAERLRRIAEHEQRPIEEVLEIIITQYPLPPTPRDVEKTDVPPAGTLARLAYELEKANFHSGQSDIVERSREILNTEMADALLKRMKNGKD